MGENFLTEGQPSRHACGAPCGAREGQCLLAVVCTRPSGHKDTGHEFVGNVGEQHVHVIWGEPEHR